MEKITEKVNLNEIERKTWRSTLEDGLLDIYFGLLVLSIGFGMTLGTILPEPVDGIISLSLMVIGFILFLFGKILGRFSL